MACDCVSASFTSSGSTTTPPRPLFCRYCEIIAAAATGSSLAPGFAMSEYMAGSWIGASAAQPASNKVKKIAAAARMNQPPVVTRVVAYQPWLNGEFSIPCGENPIAAGRQSHEVADPEFPIARRIDLDRGRPLRQFDFGALDRAEAPDMGDRALERAAAGRTEQHVMAAGEKPGGAPRQAIGRDDQRPATELH